MQSLLLSLTKPFRADYAKGAEITDDKSNDMNRIRKTIVMALMMCLCLMVQAQTTVQSSRTWEYFVSLYLNVRYAASSSMKVGTTSSATTPI